MFNEKKQYAGESVFGVWGSVLSNISARMASFLTSHLVPQVVTAHHVSPPWGQPLPLLYGFLCTRWGQGTCTWGTKVSTLLFIKAARSVRNPPPKARWGASDQRRNMNPQTTFRRGCLLFFGVKTETNRWKSELLGVASICFAT